MIAGHYSYFIDERVRNVNRKACFEGNMFISGESIKSFVNNGSDSIR